MGEQSVKKDSPINQDIQFVSQEIEKLENKINHLSESLKSVLSHLEPPKNSEGKKPPANTDLGNRIRYFGNKLEVCNEKLAFILDRIEL